MLNIGWFSTGRDEAARQLLQAVQDKIHRGDIDGKINFVFSNREPGEANESDLFFELVRSYDIPLVCLSHKKFKTAEEEEEWRIKYDKEVNKQIEPFAPDLCVLAGYMLIVGADLCQKYDMINLHPAPPGGPTGTWQEVISTIIQNEADTAGAMIHLATPELDRGPVVSYCLFSIKSDPFAEYWRKGDKDMLFRLIRQHELAREFPLIIFTLQALSRGEIGIKDRRVVNAQGKPINGYNLSGSIDEDVKKNLR
ncbi:MAG: formyltransferase family protein [Dehalococcoidia bacterium]|nr:formyltransferase family protein [Dehalococcoidia bacterium]